MVLVPAAPAAAEDPWFAPYVQTTIPNGMGPGPAPRGTASADFNSDGKPDLVTIGNFTQGNILFAPGNGNGTFGATSEIAGTTQTQGLDAGDVNGDGKADVIAMTTSQIRICLGNGAGGFTVSATYPLTLGGQVEPLLVDLDADGDRDIVAPTFTGIQTLRNNHNGTFVAGPTSQVTGASVLSSISVAKLNSDNKPDLFTTDGFSGTTYALKGSATGAFTVTGSLYATSFVPEDVAALDLNGDGYDDVATVGSFSFSLTTALTDGTGKFTGAVGTYQFGGSGPTSATAADFNGDGRKDLAVSTLAGPGTVKVLAGNGTLQMASVGDFAVASFPQNPVVADYDNDADLDLATVGVGAVSFLRNTKN